MTIDIPQAIIVASISIASTWSLAVLKNRSDLIGQRRKGAAKFLARINECLIDAEKAGNRGNQCICQESYAEFRLTLKAKEAFELEKCWNDYITSMHQNERCIECLRCLLDLTHKYTDSLASAAVPACPTCAGSGRKPGRSTVHK
jgi:hypothetical protein